MFDLARTARRRIDGRPPVRRSLCGVSENLAYTDAYLRELEATVVETDANARAVLLDRTVFYPGGGGQPADTGELSGDSGGTWRGGGGEKRGDDVWAPSHAG